MVPLWKETVTMPRFPALEGDMETDILIVGGGLAGLLCAHALERAGADYALVEMTRICNGASGNTTAKITAQHGLIYHSLLKKLGRERARQYLEANLDAVERYRELCRTIPCDFEDRDSYVYDREGTQALERELEALETLGGSSARLVRELPLPFPTAGAVCLPHQGQFHPLKFAAGLARDLRIFEHTKVRELGPHTARTDHGTIRARAVIIATHFPILNKHGGYFLKLYQERSYVLALEHGPDLGGVYVDAAADGLSFRNYGQLLLMGGPSRRTGAKTGAWKELEALAGDYFPRSRVAYRWANQDCMTLDGSAYIGPYSKGTEGLYVATGFHQWGMTGAMVAANILSDLVRGRDNPYAPAFSPHRSTLHPQLAANAGHALVNILTPRTPRCPHLGCALKYNAWEHSWDCPCHGSRFDDQGRLLDPPATDDLSGSKTTRRSSDTPRR